MKYKLRTFVVILTLFLCWAFLKDTIDWYFFMPEAEKDLISLEVDALRKLPKKQQERVQELKKKRRQVINLGLDLQGGLYMVLAVNEQQLSNYLQETYTEDLRRGKFKENPDDPALRQEVQKMIKDRFQQETRAAIEAAYSLIANRVNKFGITEPRITKRNDNRIEISLAGVKDPLAAERIVSEAGRLTFQLYDKETQARFTRTYNTNTGLFVNYDGDWLIAPDARLPEDFKVPEDSALYYIWQRDQLGLPKKKAGIFLKKKVLVEAKRIRADVGFDQIGNQARVLFRFSGATQIEQFARVTGENKGKRMAIVLDDKVQSFPVIKDKISGGAGEITGNFTTEQAKNLKAILNAGSFTVGLRVEEKRAVGPSLGRDSVNAGMQAILIGFALVVAFMLVYYKFGGLVADVALLLNMIIVLAIMTQMEATLTLPGIAGLILTLGMSVDANVIIFERIKEELRAGRAQLVVSIDKGFSRALATILDANLTTLLAALVLMQMGGAIQGFAVTLFIGILSSMYTALFVSRLIIDATISGFKLKKIAI